MSHKKLLWFAFLPTLFGLLFIGFEIAWQVFLYLISFDVLSTKDALGLLKDGITSIAGSKMVFFTGFWIVITLIYIFALKPWVIGVVMVSVRDSHPDNKEKSLRKALLEGSQYYGPLFRQHALLAAFSFQTIFLWYVTIYRYLHKSDIMGTIWIVLLIYFIAAVFINLFTFFTTQFIVYDGMDTKTAIKKSFSLIFLHFEPTLAMFVLMLLLHLRILLNGMLILGIPFIAVILLGMNVSSWLITLVIVIGIGLLCIVAYLSALVEIYQAAVWLRVFEELKVKLPSGYSA